MALPTGELVPSESERDALLDALRRLLAIAGADRFVAGPLFLPCDEHFPEPFVATLRGLRRLVRRLLAYVDLALDVDVEVYDARDPYDELDDEGRLCRLPQEAAAFTAGIRDGVAHVAVEVHQLDSLDRLVGVLAHEITHLYREHHGMVARDLEAEELLTDLTSLYLGFGVFVANNAYRYRSGGGVEGTTAYHAWSEERLGYLSPAALTYLLAVQLELRAHSSDVRSDLDPTQRAMLKAARGVLPSRELLAARLGIDLEAVDSSLSDAEALAREVVVEGDDPAGDPVLDVPLLDDRIVADNEGQRVLKLRQPRLSLAWLGGGVAMAIGLTFADTLGAAMWIVVLALVALGWRLGKRWPYHQCLGQDCGAVVAASVERCPQCGGRFARTVDDYGAILDEEPRAVV